MALFLTTVLSILSGILFLMLYNKYLHQKKYIEELKILVSIDKMTGVLNKEAGLEYLSNLLEAYRRDRQPLTICFIDIDNLKSINDTYGHLEGDSVIKMTSETIRSNVRDSDIIFRFGGDEFIIIFPKCALDEAMKIWLRIESELNKIYREKEKYFVRVSHGFSTYDTCMKGTVEELIQEADSNMFENKQSAREFYESEQFE